MKVFGKTTNFEIVYDERRPLSIIQAAALFGVVESEFDVLTGWFDVTSGFGPNNRVRVALDRSGSGANNGGYDAGGATGMSLLVAKDATYILEMIERTKMAFVAEFVEILMSYRNQHGPQSWHAARSDGEGLSRVCARERFRAGYDSQWQFPEVEAWLNSPRENWIAKNKDTDKDEASTAASMLFIYFLHSQLGFNFPDLIQAAGSTLEATYNALTGNTNGYQALRDVIDPFYPPGVTQHAPDDDIFPLLDLTHRSLSLDMTMGPTGALPQMVESGTSSVYRLGCGDRTYSFEVLLTPQEIICTAKTTGFANPAFSGWRVNGGNQIAPSGTGTFSITCLVSSINVNDVANPTQTYQPVEFNYSVITQGAQSMLRLQCPALAGTATLDVSVAAFDEYFMPDAQSSTMRSGVVQNEALVWEPSYYSDAPKCRDNYLNRFRQVAAPFNWLVEGVAIILTLPDPEPSELTAISFKLTRLAQFRDELKRAGESQIVNELDRFMLERSGAALAALKQLPWAISPGS